MDNQRNTFAEWMTENTRKERRALLLVAIVTIAICGGYLTPQRLSLGGMDLSVADQGFIFRLLLWVDLYFCVAFFIYAGADMVFHLNASTLTRSSDTRPREVTEYSGALVVYWVLKFAIDWLLPLAFGLYALSLASHATPVLPSYPIWTMPH